jgi:ribonuclease R
MTKLEARILKILGKYKRMGLNAKELSKKIGLSKADRAALRDALESLTAQRLIAQYKDRYVLLRGNLLTGEVVSITGTYGFVRPLAGGKDLFIPGRHLLGAMPKDRVLVRYEPNPIAKLREGKIEEILEPANHSFSGVLTRDGSDWFVLPDNHARFPFAALGVPQSAQENDKVLARLCYRGERYLDHLVEIEAVFGSADSAAVCCAAVLAEQDIPLVFSADVLSAADEIAGTTTIHPKEIESRLDLRAEVIFTMDGSDTKDIDDAVSLQRIPGGWELGVHIADVSHYVLHKSALDTEAYRRGTSVYFADQVIPMLPPALSNGICSLNPQQDRLALSALMRLNDAGELETYRFAKTVIRSRVQGVYQEINQLLTGSAPPALTEKYAEISDPLLQMSALAAILFQRRLLRGSVDLDIPEGKIVMGADGAVADVVARTRGQSERIIEEFMLTANEAAARFSEEQGLPCVYRVHSSPAPEKTEALTQTLDRLGIAHNIRGSISSNDLTAILLQTKGHSAAPIIQNLILRSMSKAVYSYTNTGHFGLALADYAHFTSPIRRYSDLAVHRIFSAHITGMRKDRLLQRYQGFAQVAGEQATRRELAALTAERDCEDCYKAEYMRRLIGEEFDGIVAGATAFGLFVQLPNTIEGRLSLQDFPEGRWRFDGLSCFENEHGRRLQLGDRLRVKVAGAQVSAGQIHFIFAEL